MFRSQQIIIREYVCTSLKLLNYLIPDDDLLRSKHVGVFLYIFIYFNTEIGILD